MDDRTSRAGQAEERVSEPAEAATRRDEDGPDVEGHAMRGPDAARGLRDEAEGVRRAS